MKELSQSFQSVENFRFWSTLKIVDFKLFFSDVKYFVHASLVWRSWARALKFYTRINQGLTSCLVKVLSRSVENYRFWSTLKIVDFKRFFSDVKYFVHASWVWRSWARGFTFYTRINQDLKSCLVEVLSRSVENCRFWSTLKIVDFKLLFFRCQAREFGLNQLS